MTWLLLALVGCADTTPVATPRSRVDAVMADPSNARQPAEFCDTYGTSASAKPMAWPELAEGEAWAAQTGWRWVNVWATWCGPCIAEMPRLVSWRGKLVAEGANLELVFVSVDERAQDLTKFYRKRPDMPPTVRIAAFDQLAGWFDANGLDRSTPIPIHFFVDDEGRTRCIRTGEIAASEYDTIQRVLAGQ